MSDRKSNMEKRIKEARDIAKDYRGNITIGIFGSHSAKEVGIAAKSWGLGEFKTVIIVEKGRNRLYTKYNRHLYDEVITLDSFKDLLKKEIQDQLIEMNTILIPNRSFSVYVGYDEIEKDFRVPVYGNRFLLRTEDRDFEKGQYYLLEKAGIKIPKEFKSPEEIDRLAVVKVQQAKNSKERAYFYPSSPKDYYKEAKEKLKSGTISKAGLKKARIEEYVLGSRFNANFHSYSPASKGFFGDFDFVGFSDRRQVNLQGFLNLPAKEQLKIKVPVENEEIGHFGITMRESKQIFAYNAAEKFIRTCENEYPPGIIGMFGLQGAIAYSPEHKLEYVIFDVSPRVPGDPAIGPTSPEMRNLSIRHGVKIGDPLDLTMMEIKGAFENKILEKIVT